jgi:transcriptional regulator with XRE-family HTH domain
MGMASPSTPRNTQRNRPDRQVLSRLDTGALVREARRIAGLSQSELAARVGTTQSAVSNWERGRDVPRVDTLGRILQACGFEVDLTFRRHDDVDRSQIARLVQLEPDDRADAFDSLVDAYELARRARRLDRSA